MLIQHFSPYCEIRDPGGIATPRRHSNRLVSCSCNQKKKKKNRRKEEQEDWSTWSWYIIYMELVHNTGGRGATESVVGSGASTDSYKQETLGQHEVGQERHKRDMRDMRDKRHEGQEA